jgi:hypothetical protein
MDRLNDLMNSSTPQKITEDEIRTYVKRVKESFNFMDRITKQEYLIKIKMVIQSKSLMISNVINYT